MRARIGDRHLGAQPVEREPPAQIVEPRRLAVEQQRLALRDDEKIVQVVALRRQQRGIERALRAGLGHVVGDQSLQEGDAIRARDLEHAARVEQREERSVGPLPLGS